MKNLKNFVNIQSINQYILEAKESIEVGGIKFKEGDRVIYLKKYKDENGDDVEEEITGTIDEIFPSKKINIEFGEDKFAVIQSSDLVGLIIKSKSYKFSTKSNTEDKYREELDDINYEVNELIDRIDQINSDMEEDIIDAARQAWLKDNPDKGVDDFSQEKADKYMDKAGSEWAETSGLNDLEKELEDLKKKQEKAQKKLDDYLAKDGIIKTKNGNVKYINGYEPIK